MTRQTGLSALGWMTMEKESYCPKIYIFINMTNFFGQIYKCYVAIELKKKQDN